MDPLSITASCIGILSSITSLSKQLSDFVRHARDARKDIDIVRRDVTSLSILVEHLEADTKDLDIQYPDHLKSSLVDVLQECEETIAKMALLVSKVALGSVGRQVRWAFTGKDEMEKLRIRLEGYKSTISLVLDMMTTLILNNVKIDTTTIIEDTTAIKQSNDKIYQDTTQLLSEINELKEKLSRAEARQLPDKNRGFVLQRFLDQSTAYAETIIDGSLGHMEIDLDSGGEKEENIVQTNLSLSANSLADKSPSRISIEENKTNKTEETVRASASNLGVLSFHSSNESESAEEPLLPEPEKKITCASSSEQLVAARNSQRHERSRTIDEVKLKYEIHHLFNNPPEAIDALSKLKELIEGGADISDVSGSTVLLNMELIHYHSALQAAILIWPDDKLVVEYLLNSGADVNAQCECDAPRSCQTALRAATMVGSADIISCLLERGADANARREKELTALHIAALRLNHDIAGELIIYGADIYALADIDGDVLCKALYQSKYFATGYKHVLKSLNALKDLKVFDSSPGASKSKISVLTMVVSRCCSAKLNSKAHKVIELLLTNGTDANIKKEHLAKSLEETLTFRCQSCIRLLLDYGARVNIENPPFLWSFLMSFLGLRESPSATATSCALEILKQATGRLGLKLYNDLMDGVDEKLSKILKKNERKALKNAIIRRYLQDNPGAPHPLRH